jgi:hypothetical protein
MKNLRRSLLLPKPGFKHPLTAVVSVFKGSYELLPIQTSFNRLKLILSSPCNRYRAFAEAKQQGQNINLETLDNASF